MTGDPWDLLWPRPARLSSTGETLSLVARPRVAGTPGDGEAEDLLARAFVSAGWKRAAAEGPPAVHLVAGPVPGSSRERYRLEVGADGARVTAPEAVGRFRGAATLAQWIRQHASRGKPGSPLELPGLHVEDGPDFEHRGVMLDISRNKVPTLATLRRLVDLLASLKVNQLQLYMENTFAYRGHGAVWRGWSPLRPGEIRELDAYCRERFIELVPNQNSFGHFHRWLIHEPYRQLAECPEGVEHPFSPEPEPFSLCPLDPRAQELLEDLYDQLLPNFRSRLFNVGLDETFDLGEGRSAKACRQRGKERVYLEFLTRIRDLVADRGRRMLFWGDVILDRPELIAELPHDAVALEWGYEADHPFAEDCRRFASSGLEFWVCPGTGTWNSFAGRTRNTLRNLASAARHGHEQGAKGYLVCDWGDNGHLQTLPASYPGLVAGAGFAWNVSTARAPEDLPLAELVDRHVFDLTGPASGPAAGAVLTSLGEAYRRTGAEARNGSALFFLWLFAGRPADQRRSEGMTIEKLEETLDFIGRAAAPLASPLVARRRRLRRELEWTRDVLACACRLGSAWLESGFDRPLHRLPRPLRRELAGEIEDLARRLRPVWLARHRPGGLDASLGRFLEAHRLLIGSEA